MPRILHRRALPPLVVFLQMSLVAGAAAANGERSSVVQQAAPSAVLNALESWLVAVNEHQPGVRDDALERVGRWSGADLGWLLAEGLLPLLRACERPVRQRLPSVGGVRTPRPRDRLTGTEWAFIRQLTAGLCNTGAGLAQAPRLGAVDRLLRAGAILHGDAAMLALPDPGTGAWRTGSPRTRPAAGSGSGLSMLADGTQTPLPNTAPAHWDMARMLLDQVRGDPSDPKPSPRRDPMVRSWYRATLAFMAAVPYGDTTHIERAAELFDNDAVVHLLAGSLREWMASDSVQQATEHANARFVLPPGAAAYVVRQRFPVGSTRTELERARRHFERASQLDPALIEAQVRLGRVLGRLERHDEAAAVLRPPAATEAEPQIQYFANLFLAAEEEALGRPDEARRAYLRAASLYPDAPTPRLGLSHLARREGKRDEALWLVGKVITPHPDGSEPSDPLWTYFRAAGRTRQALMREMVRDYLESTPEKKVQSAPPRR